MVSPVEIFQRVQAKIRPDPIKPKPRLHDEDIEQENHGVGKQDGLTGRKPRADDPYCACCHVLKCLIEGKHVRSNHDGTAADQTPQLPSAEQEAFHHAENFQLKELALSCVVNTRVIDRLAKKQAQVKPQRMINEQESR